MSFFLSVLTPSGKVFEEKVDSIAAPGLLGGFEVYSGHASILVALKEGVIKIRKPGSDQHLITGSGILEVIPDHSVLVLVDSVKLT